MPHGGQRRSGFSSRVFRGSYARQSVELLRSAERGVATLGRAWSSYRTGADNRPPSGEGSYKIRYGVALRALLFGKREIAWVPKQGPLFWIDVFEYLDKPNVSSGGIRDIADVNVSNPLRKLTEKTGIDFGVLLA